MKKFLVIFVLIVISVSITAVSAQSQYQIPSWIKGVAGYWAEGKITDNDFGEALSFLINNEMIKVPKIQELQNEISQLKTENTYLRSKLNVSEPSNTVSKECGSNQIWQNNECQNTVIPKKNNLSLQTNKDLYYQGDTVTVSGTIPNFDGDETKDVAIIVRAPDNNIVAIIQTHPNTNGSFQTSFDADGQQFIKSGEFKIHANFSGLKSEITFKFTGGDGSIVSGGETPITCPSGQTLINGKCAIKQYSPNERMWQKSGSFQLDRTEYAIGEKIFLKIEGLNSNEKGQIAVMRPLNATHYSVYLTIPFDGADKPAFNYYLEPQISKTREICSVDDLIGKWAVVFRGTDYPNLYFEITDKVVSGTNIAPAC